MQLEIIGDLLLHELHMQIKYVITFDLVTGKGLLHVWLFQILIQQTWHYATLKLAINLKKVKDFVTKLIFHIFVYCLNLIFDPKIIRERERER